MEVARDPLVSVIIPNFNYGAYLAQALSSLISQTFENWEAIVVDNFSTDDSSEVVKNFSDPRIYFETFSNNGSIAASRNHGVQKSRGEYIAFLDSDDYWYSTKLAESLDALRQGADVTHHHLDIVGKVSKFGSRYVRGKNLYRDPLGKLLTKGNGLATSSVVVSKPILYAVGLMDEDPNLMGVEDYDAWLKIASRGGVFKLLDKRLGAYRIHGASISRQRMAHKVRAVVERNLLLSDKASQNKAEAFLRYVEALEAFQRRESGRALYRKLAMALRFGPLDIKLRALFMLVTMKSRSRM